MSLIPGTGSSQGSGARQSDGSRLLCPDGVQRIVCCDVVDLGMQDDTWAGGPPRKKHKCQIRWLSEHIRPTDGQMFLLAKRYTFSMHERATLRKELGMWRGQPFTDAEASAFDLEKLIGVCALANVAHVQRKGDMYAEVLALMPLGKEHKKLAVPPTYKRESAPPAVEEESDAPPF